MGEAQNPKDINVMRAAGVAFITGEGKVLFLCRSDTGDHGGEYCFPGGGVEDGESLLDCVKRECVEEIGQYPEGTPEIMARAINGVDYTTFIQRVDGEFEPILNEEHTKFVWAYANEPPKPLHPGVEAALTTITGTETDVARLMADGRLSSPTKFANIDLFDLRITGSGVSYRDKVDEIVYRPPEYYVTDEFLRRCNGLPIIIEHPKDDILDGEEFQKRVCGTILLPYVKGDEPWGIARIYDERAAQMMRETQLSTSPGVQFMPFDKNSNGVLADGTKILAEAIPSLIDHLAICVSGVWDKGGAPTGVRSETVGEQAMPDPESNAAEVKKEGQPAMDSGGVNIDNLLTKLDAAMKRMDAMEAGEDQEACLLRELEELIGEDEEVHGEEATVAAEAERAADETAQMQEPEPKYDSSALMSHLKGLHAKLKAKKMGQHSDGVRMDGKKKTVKEGFVDPGGTFHPIRSSEGYSRRKAGDSAMEGDLKSRLDAVESKLKEMPEDEKKAYTDAQAKCDSVAVAFGDSAPRPLHGESLLDYRKRLISPFKKHSPTWADKSIEAIGDSATFGVVEQQIYQDAINAAKSPQGIGNGRLREVVRRSDSGHTIREFYGRPLSWMGQFMHHSIRVKGLKTQQKDS
jgi:8-oxo-dGTP pyrophosphatase MutT (NUDIX family)